MKSRKNRGWVLGWVGATATTQLQCSDFSLTEAGTLNQEKKQILSYISAMFRVESTV
ncbi:MAG: hypothetical protein KTR16_16455 [Acidiferrobacterales bacterium]|nr:hypothetical protein [Acidiferrobacterales bacterium]